MNKTVSLTILIIALLMPFVWFLTYLTYSWTSKSNGYVMVFQLTGPYIGLFFSIISRVLLKKADYLKSLGNLAIAVNLFLSAILTAFHVVMYLSMSFFYGG